jgi:hypothetical protein
MDVCGLCARTIATLVLEGASHPRQLQRARVGDDEIPDDRGGGHPPTPASQPS